LAKWGANYGNHAFWGWAYQARFVKLPIIFLTVADVGHVVIRKWMVQGSGFSHNI